MQDFYKSYTSSRNDYVEYRDRTDKWEESYDERAQSQEKESVYKKLQNYLRENINQQEQRISKNRSKGAR